MRLTPREQDRLTIFLAAQLARTRRERGLRLNVPEAAALISDVFCEAARDGATLAEATDRARAALGPDDVLPGTSDVLHRIEIEALFDDGSRLAVIDDPIGGGGLGDAAPGAVLTAAEPIPYPDLPVTPLEVTNTAPVPIAVTSHWHFFEANPRLRFDRAASFGRRLHVPGGLQRAVRAGHHPRRRAGRHRRRPGGDRVRRARRRRARRARRPRGGAREGAGLRLRGGLMLDRDAYARTYGATTGDRIRLGDSGLQIRIETTRPSPATSC